MRSKTYNLNLHGAIPSVSLLCGAALFLASPRLAPAQEKPPAGDKGQTNAKSKPGHALLNGLQEAFTDIAEEVEPAVVTIYSTKSGASGDHSGDTPIAKSLRRSTGSGSGVLIDSRGWVLTNDHVIGSADRVMVRLHDGRDFPGKAYRDPRSDLAMIKIGGKADTFPVARLGDSDKVKIGNWAVAIGSPYRYEGSFSVGVISSLYRRQEIGDFDLPGGKRVYSNMIQTDAAVNPGNSGGPLCNIEGEVIAINTAIESDSGGSVGIGFAIPINAAKFVINELMTNGKVHYGYLGINPTSVTPRLAAYLKVPDGALIADEPDNDTPAAKAGIKAGDIVIALDTTPVHTEADLRTLIAQTRPGNSVTLKLIRAGQEMRVKAQVTEAPDLIEKPAPASARPHLGIDVEPLTEAQARKYKLTLKLPALVIKSIDTSSAASDNEFLSKGVVILSVNDIPTPNIKEYLDAVANLRAGTEVRLLCLINNKEKVVILSVE